VEGDVDVDPKLLVQQSFTPAILKTILGISPATSPKPLGPGSISMATLPHLPLTLKGS
jgi:hypothetical protein